ncbi:hypothetical protein C8Q77DRAFT_1052185 [Trametes polyzona]|nr:hypothetical protein C8Q77DRAFT_1052185 [Trametes polyzona]
MEEGEIVAEELTASFPTSVSQGHPAEDPSGTAYSPALEWPGDEETPSELPVPVGTAGHTGYANPSLPSSSLRLLVRHSTVLRKPQKVALLDGYSEIQVGRDLAPPGSDVPRIRLKEMEVSKLHATIYWDGERSQWSIVDMGSKHGTFIRSVPSTSGATLVSPSSGAISIPLPDGMDERGFRLSAPRIASMPRPLHHSDIVTIGGTAFVVHIHELGLPCADCSPQANEEIPLFASSGASSNKRKLDAANIVSAPGIPQPRNPKKALATLKRSLLSAAASTPSSAPGSSQLQYVDRSARRRALHPERPPVPTPNAERARQSAFIPAPPSPPSPPPVSTPPIPVPASNIGHRLLLKQGWRPGSTLGDPSNDSPGLLTPLEPASTVGRAGLGASVRPPNSTLGGQNGNWRDVGKRRRWAEGGSADNLP